MSDAAGLLFDDRPTPERIIADALEADGPAIRTYCLFSGGGDSIVVAHRCRDLYDELAHIDTGTALPGVREHVHRVAELLDKPLRVLDNGPEPYRRLVLGDRVWWDRYRAARVAAQRDHDAARARLGLTPAPERANVPSIADFIRAEAGTRRPGDGLGKCPQGFPGPAGGHRAAYSRLKEAQVERLVRDTRAELGRPDRAVRVALLSGARSKESARRRRNTFAGPHRRRGAQLWINPLQWWTDDEMRAYRREHDLPLSDVAALLHRSGECNCGAYISRDERADVVALYPDWFAETIAPLEAEARELGIPRCVWGERADTARAGARGAGDADDDDDSPMCSDCQLRFA